MYCYSFVGAVAAAAVAVTFDAVFVVVVADVVFGAAAAVAVVSRELSS